LAERVLNKDSHGGRVQAATFPGHIPARQVHLGSTRVPNSFDSRYLGLQPTSLPGANDSPAGSALERAEFP
jgi:hypothetical protein